jgi:hypothetical protein
MVWCIAGDLVAVGDAPTLFFLFPMPLPEWFELEASAVRIDAGIEPHQIGDATLGVEGLETKIDEHIEAQFKIAFLECKQAAGSLSFPITDDNLQDAESVVITWPVIVAFDTTACERRRAEEDAKNTAIITGLVVPYPLKVEFKARSGDPDDNAAITQDDIDGAETAAAATRTDTIAQHIEQFKQAVSEMVISKLWYSAVTGENTENAPGKSHYITAKQLLGSLKSELQRLDYQARINRGSAFF